MDTILTLVNKGNDFLWSFLLLILLCGTGIYYTIRLKFIQVRKFGEGCKHVFGHFSLNGEKHEKGEMSPFQSIMTAIAAQVGTGNLAGAATALFGGGPGAIFWMWLSAFFGMATIYSEAVLAQTYKTEVNGEVTGGPVYYIKAAFKGNFGKILSTLFAIFIVLALGFMGNMVQSNSIGAAFTEVFQVYGINIPPITIGLVLAVLAGFIFIGGTKRLAAVVEKVVPVMAGVYIVGSLILIGLHINHVPTAFMMIIKGAFDPKAVMGAGAGITVREAIRFGVARGLFSNEAGMGSTPHAHARAKAESPHHQGLCAMISVFIDTFVILKKTHYGYQTSTVLIPNVLGEYEGFAKYGGRRDHTCCLTRLPFHPGLSVRIQIFGPCHPYAGSQPGLSPAGFLYGNIAPVYFKIQRDHTREDVIPGYRHLFFPLCRTIRQSILQRSYPSVVALPQFPHGTTVRLFPPAVAERHPFVTSDIHTVAKPYQAVPPVPAELRVCHSCRFGTANVAKRHSTRDSFRRRPVHLDHLRLRDRTDNSRCSNDLHTYGTYHHHVPYPDRRYRSHDFHQLFRPFFHGAFIFHQQTRTERHVERRPGERTVPGDP